MAYDAGKALHAAGKALHAAAKAVGEFDYRVQWAGQGTALARSLPAAELVEVLESEMEQALRRTEGPGRPGGALPRGVPARRPPRGFKHPPVGLV
jgi:hypothetical protein